MLTSRAFRHIETSEASTKLRAQVNDAAVLAVFAAVRSATGPGSRPGSEDRIDVAGVLAQQPTAGQPLRSLDLSGLHGQALHLEEAVDTLLRASTTLTTLDMAANELEDDDAITLARGLRSNRTLHCLSLQYNRIGGHCGSGMTDLVPLPSSQGVQAIGAALCTSSLMELSLSHCPVGPSGAAILAAALKGGCRLQQLKLCGCQLCGLDPSHSVVILPVGVKPPEYTPTGLVELSHALCVSSSLTSIDLGYNLLRADVVAVLANALHANTTLANLVLSSNELGPEGAAAMGRMLLRNTGLTSLELNRCNLCGTKYAGGSYNPEGVQVLAASLATNGSLRALKMHDNDLTGDTYVGGVYRPEAIHALAGALRANTALTALDAGVWRSPVAEEELKEAAALANPMRETQLRVV